MPVVAWSTFANRKKEEDSVATLKKYDLAGQALGDIDIDDALLSTAANAQMIKDYLVAIRANRRQWSASTQTRAEVSHSKKKPFAQKGTGNARQGFLGSPQFRGGGRVHAPRPKFDQHVRINKKSVARRSAVFSARRSVTPMPMCSITKRSRNPRPKRLENS